MATHALDQNLLYHLVNRRREQEELSWRGLAFRLDVQPSTFTRMKSGRRPDIDTLRTLLHWLKMPANLVTVSLVEDGE